MLAVTVVEKQEKTRLLSDSTADNAYISSEKVSYVIFEIT